MPLSNGKPGSPRWRKAGRPAKMPNKVLSAAETEALQGRAFEDLNAMLDRWSVDPPAPEEMAKQASAHAIRSVLSVMTKPGRHAATQLAAAREMLKYGVQEPAKAQTITSDTTHRLEGDINIVLVPAKDGRRTE